MENTSISRGTLGLEGRKGSSYNIGSFHYGTLQRGLLRKHLHTLHQTGHLRVREPALWE